MVTGCVDLRSIGERYRPWNETAGRRAHATDDPWELILPGRGGCVAPWGRGLLVACTRGNATTKKIIADVPGARVVQDAADGQNIIFAAKHLDAVAGLLRLLRRRVLSAGQRRAATDRLKPFCYQPSRTSGHSSDAQRTKSSKSKPNPPPRPDRGRKSH